MMRRFVVMAALAAGVLAPAAHASLAATLAQGARRVTWTRSQTGAIAPSTSTPARCCTRATRGCRGSPASGTRKPDGDPMRPSGPRARVPGCEPRCEGGVPRRDDLAREPRPQGLRRSDVGRRRARRSGSAGARARDSRRDGEPRRRRGLVRRGAKRARLAFVLRGRGVASALGVRSSRPARSASSRRRRRRRAFARCSTGSESGSSARRRSFAPAASAAVHFSEAALGHRLPLFHGRDEATTSPPRCSSRSSGRHLPARGSTAAEPRSCARCFASGRVPLAGVRIVD